MLPTTTRRVGGAASVPVSPRSRLASAPVTAGYATPLPMSARAPKVTAPVVGTRGRVATEIDKVNAKGRVVERDFISGTAPVISAAPNVVKRAVSPGKRAVSPVVSTRGVSGTTPYVTSPMVSASPPVVTSPRVIATTPTVPVNTGIVREIDMVNAVGQVVERDLVAGSGVSRMISAPSPVVTSPKVVKAAPAAPVTRGVVREIDKVNALGQVVERDVVAGSGVSRMISAPAPVMTSPVLAASTIPVTRGVTETVADLSKTRVISGPASVAATPTFVTAPPLLTSSQVVTSPRVITATSPRALGGVTEIDKVNARGKVVERDFVGSTRIAAPATRAAKVI